MVCLMLKCIGRLSYMYICTYVCNISPSPETPRGNNMPRREESLVLRTVYLPKDLDDELRQLAFSQGSSKNELIREAVKTAFATWRRQALSTPRSTRSGTRG